MLHGQVKAQENGGLGVAQRRSHANQTKQFAFQPGFLLEFSEGCLFGALSLIHVSFGKPPPVLVRPGSFLHEQNAVVPNDASGHSQVTK